MIFYLIYQVYDFLYIFNWYIYYKKKKKKKEKEKKKKKKKKGISKRFNLEYNTMHNIFAKHIVFN
jgi:hypothetical protein